MRLILDMETVLRLSSAADDAPTNERDGGMLGKHSGGVVCWQLLSFLCFLHFFDSGSQIAINSSIIALPPARYIPFQEPNYCEQCGSSYIGQGLQQVRMLQD